MIKNVFDMIDEEPEVVEKQKTTSGGSIESIFDMIDDTEPSDSIASESEEIPWWKSVSSDVLKGLVEGAVSTGKMIGPLVEDPREAQQKQEELTKTLEKALPSDETFVGSSLRRGIKTGLPSMAFPGAATLGMAAKSVVSGFAGQSAEELGAPEWLQTVAEFAPFITPSIGKKIQPTKAQKPIVDFLRGKGASEAEIAPLLQGERRSILGKQLPSKQQLLSRVAKKGERVGEKLGKTHERLQSVYNDLLESPAAETVLTQNSANNLVDKLDNILNSMSSSNRNVILEDFNQLKNSMKSGKDLMTFWKQINQNIGTNQSLAALKKPLGSAIETLSPAVSKDFKMINDLYKKYYSIRQSIDPNQYKLLQGLVDISEIGAFFGGLVSGNFPLMMKAVGADAARRVSRELLINPRLQNLSKQVLKAASSGKYAIASNLKNKIAKELEDEFPEFATDLKELDFKEL